MPSYIENTFNIEGVCRSCGSKLHGKSTLEIVSTGCGTKYTITVDACKECRDIENKNGYDKGYEDGVKEINNRE